MRRCRGVRPELSGRCRSHRLQVPGAPPGRRQDRPAHRRRVRRREPPPATHPAPASGQHQGPPGRLRAAPPGRRQDRPAHRRRVRRREPPPEIHPAPASGQHQGPPGRLRAAPPGRRQGHPTRRPQPARRPAAWPAAAGSPAGAGPSQQRRKPGRGGRTIPWGQEKLISVCRRRTNRAAGQSVPPERQNHQTASAAAPTRLRRAPITACCWASASSGKIGRLSTSAQSRSVTGRLPGP